MDMANEYDYENGGGSGFMMGLLTGTVLGAGLGMLLAPKSGSELRGRISETASRVSNAASENYQKIADKASSLAGRGREIGRDVAGRAREAVSAGAEEVQRYRSESTSAGARGPASSPGSSSGSPSTPGSPYSSGPSGS
jgi:gas vesicle protein